MTSNIWLTTSSKFHRKAYRAVHVLLLIFSLNIQILEFCLSGSLPFRKCFYPGNAPQLFPSQICFRLWQPTSCSARSAADVRSVLGFAQLSCLRFWFAREKSINLCVSREIHVKWWMTDSFLACNRMEELNEILDTAKDQSSQKEQDEVSIVGRFLL